MQIVIETSKQTAEVTQDLGIHDSTPGNRVTAWREHPEPGQAPSPVERPRVSDLERENRRLRPVGLHPMIHYAQ